VDSTPLVKDDEDSDLSLNSPVRKYMKSNREKTDDIIKRVIHIEESSSEERSRRNSYSILQEDPEVVPEDNERSIRLEDAANFEDLEVVSINKEALLHPKDQDSIDKERMFALSKEKSVRFENSPGMLEALNKVFGEQMTPYFETYFEPFIDGRRYEWSGTMCKAYLLKDQTFEDVELDNSEPTSESFNQSFSLSCSANNEVMRSYNYLKYIFESNKVTSKDIIDFAEGTYFKPGLINTYLRLLEVYHEYEQYKIG